MRAINATVTGLLASSVAVLGAGCRRSSPASRPRDAGATVTVYLPSSLADRFLGVLQQAAASHQWALSVRTDSAALAEADLTIADSAGRTVARVRDTSPVAAQAQLLANAVIR